MASYPPSPLKWKPSVEALEALWTARQGVLKEALAEAHVSASVIAGLIAKLKPRATLMHVVAMTRSLGEQRSPKDEQPEVFRWTDTGGSYVDCTFAGGKLVGHQLTRPAEETQAPAHQTPPAP